MEKVQEYRMMGHYYATVALVDLANYYNKDLDKMFTAFESIKAKFMNDEELDFEDDKLDDIATRVFQSFMYYEWAHYYEIEPKDKPKVLSMTSNKE